MARFGDDRGDMLRSFEPNSMNYLAQYRQSTDSGFDSLRPNPLQGMENQGQASPFSFFSMFNQNQGNLRELIKKMGISEPNSQLPQFRDLTPQLDQRENLNPSPSYDTVGNLVINKGLYQ